MNRSQFQQILPFPASPEVIDYQCASGSRARSDPPCCHVTFSSEEFVVQLQMAMKSSTYRVFRSVYCVWMTCLAPLQMVSDCSCKQEWAGWHSKYYTGHSQNAGICIYIPSSNLHLSIPTALVHHHSYLKHLQMVGLFLKSQPDWFSWNLHDGRAYLWCFNSFNLNGLFLVAHKTSAHFLQLLPLLYRLCTV